MKRMKRVILSLLLMIPIVLYAASRQTYSDAAGTANNLMNTGYYQNTSNQYILTTVGGDKLIDKDDYEKSKYNGRTYLSDGVEYWTKTDCSGGKYVVTASGDLECKSTGANYNTRASYYVKPNVSVTGRGTYDSPWMFEPMYKVTIMETPIGSGDVGVSEKYVPKNGTVTFEGVKVPTILCHRLSYDYKLGGCHSDVLEWFNIFGYTMDNVRKDVTALLNTDEEGK